ncbi:MAG: GNAT family N-acetyltransferase [Gloeobacteraceae cyanobacterium ES-bin-316]|nr:GNAT family N-acetyltransferase [Ferruginibacter sp.]
MNQPIWICKKMNDLTVDELYCIFQLRSEVFVVEQNCVYQDADGKDNNSYHFCGWLDNLLVSYCRILPPGLSYPEASIGRVLSHPSHRKAGYGKIMMEKSIQKTYEMFDVPEIKIGAQLYLLTFYKNLGFKPLGETYLEDNIPHITMLHRR